MNVLIIAPGKFGDSDLVVVFEVSSNWLSHWTHEIGFALNQIRPVAVGDKSVFLNQTPLRITGRYDSFENQLIDLDRGNVGRFDFPTRPKELEMDP